MKAESKGFILVQQIILEDFPSFHLQLVNQEDEPNFKLGQLGSKSHF